MIFLLVWHIPPAASTVPSSQFPHCLHVLHHTHTLSSLSGSYIFHFAIYMENSAICVEWKEKRVRILWCLGNIISLVILKWFVVVSFVESHSCLSKYISPRNDCITFSLHFEVVSWKKWKTKKRANERVEERNMKTWKYIRNTIVRTRKHRGTGLEALEKRQNIMLADSDKEERNQNTEK